MDNSTLFSSHMGNTYKFKGEIEHLSKNSVYKNLIYIPLIGEILNKYGNDILDEKLFSINYYFKNLRKTVMSFSLYHNDRFVLFEFEEKFVNSRQQSRDLFTKEDTNREVVDYYDYDIKISSDDENSFHKSGDNEKLNELFNELIIKVIELVVSEKVNTALIRPSIKLSNSSGVVLSFGNEYQEIFTLKYEFDSFVDLQNTVNNISNSLTAKKNTIKLLRPEPIKVMRQFGPVVDVLFVDQYVLFRGKGFGGMKVLYEKGLFKLINSQGAVLSDTGEMLIYHMSESLTRYEKFKGVVEWTYQSVKNWWKLNK